MHLPTDCRPSEGRRRRHSVDCFLDAYSLNQALNRASLCVEAAVVMVPSSAPLLLCAPIQSLIDVVALLAAADKRRKKFGLSRSTDRSIPSIW